MGSAELQFLGGFSRSWQSLTFARITSLSVLRWIFAGVSVDGRSRDETFPGVSVSCALFLSIPGFLKVHLI